MNSYSMSSTTSSTLIERLSATYLDRLAELNEQARQIAAQAETHAE